MGQSGAVTQRVFLLSDMDRGDSIFAQSVRKHSPPPIHRRKGDGKDIKTINWMSFKKTLGNTTHNCCVSCKMTSLMKYTVIAGVATVAAHLPYPPLGQGYLRFPSEVTLTPLSEVRGWPTPLHLQWVQDTGPSNQHIPSLIMGGDAQVTSEGPTLQHLSEILGKQSSLLPQKKLQDPTAAGAHPCR